MLRSKFQRRIRNEERLRRLARKADKRGVGVREYVRGVVHSWLVELAALRIRTSKEVFNDFYFR
jgi:hypothetical protein